MESVFLPMQRFLFERELIWIDCDPLTVVLQCTNVNNRSVSALTTLESGLVGRTTECVNPISMFVLCESASLAIRSEFWHQVASSFRSFR